MQPHQQLNPQFAGVELIPVSERGKVEHTEDEIKLYGKILDLDIEGQDRDLKWIAKQGLEAPIPKDWKIYQSSSSNNESSGQTNQYVYINKSSNQVMYQHPLDPYFKALAKREQFFRDNGIYPNPTDEQQP